MLKGRPWSSVEHLVLQSLVRSAKTANEISELSFLPRRLIIEVLVRLMRVGWVEIGVDPSGSRFRATLVGTEKAGADELPSALRSTKRWIPFVVDRVTGTPYRARDLPSFPKAKIEARANFENIVWLTPAAALEQVEPRDLLTNLTEEDEHIIGFDPSNERPSELYAVVSVRDGVIEGLPGRAPEFLADEIRAAASLVPATSTTKAPQNLGYSAQAFAPSPVLRQAVHNADDMVLGGAAHQARLEQAIQRAQSRIIIHSTFVSESGLIGILPSLKQAAHRGVRTDIVWGQGDTSPRAAEARELLARFRAQLISEGFEGKINVHPHSTGSHAKILIADDGVAGRFSATIGSCNWLSAGFGSFDASIRTRDPGLVSDALNVVAKLTCGRDGHWADWTAGLVQLSIAACKETPPKGLKADACLVLGNDHGYFVRRARDEAKHRLFVASHRWSEVGNRSIVIPAISAVQASRGVEAKILYNQVSGGLTNTDASTRILELRRSGVSIQPVHEPRLHAKVLAWDDDCLVVTSQNWLSADVSPDNRSQEVGIFLQFPRVADDLIRVFEGEHLS